MPEQLETLSDTRVMNALLGDEFTANASDPDGAERTGPGNIADHQGSTGADDAQDIRIIFTIRAQEHGLDLDLIVPTFGK